MAGADSQATYHPVARFFHWLMAALLVMQVAVALTMAALEEGPWAERLTSWHEWTGIVLLALVTLRFAWRLVRPPPPLDAPPLLRLGAHAVHGAIYVLLFAIPLTGWMMSSALGFPVAPFGLFTLPDLVGRDRTLGFQLLAAHTWMGMALIGLVLLHAGAALMHHLVLRDGTLRRMWPRSPAGTA